MDDSTVKQKVLVADDDPTILRVVSMILEKEGLEVITAEDGEEAFEKISTEGPDAILLDIEMPRMGGIELCSRLKATEVTASVVFIPKPFQPEKLVMFVGLLLSSKRKGEKTKH
jgi:two-component system alkaline phosphatase synthesis response regulator PhoP